MPTQGAILVIARGVKYIIDNTCILFFSQTMFSNIIRPEKCKQHYNTCIAKPCYCISNLDLFKASSTRAVNMYLTTSTSTPYKITCTCPMSRVI